LDKYIKSSFRLKCMLNHIAYTCLNKVKSPHRNTLPFYKKLESLKFGYFF